MSQKVVAHYVDHAVVKGTSLDVDPSKPVCHVRTDTGAVEVDMRDLKALFFVKDLSGQPAYNEEHSVRDGDARVRGSTQVRIRFTDGEELGALMNRFPPNRPFFFVVPMDQKSNNVRVLVNRDAVSAMEEIASAPPPAPPTDAPPARSKRTSWVFDGKDIKHIPTDR